MAEEILYDSAPSMFRNNPFWFIIYLVVPIIGWIVLLMWGPKDNQTGIIILGTIISVIGWGSFFFWWLQNFNTRLVVSKEKVTFKRGILSRNIITVFLSDVRSVEINQSFMQRIMGTGKLEISSAASSDAEIIIKGIPDAYEVKKIIDENRHRNRK
ncbi:MAG: PH domain-containing protein [Candidatus Marithrix sp.]|nr:PH domain-containing protein [Candidatus Marithrix sp.]